LPLLNYCDVFFIKPITREFLSVAQEHENKNVCATSRKVDGSRGLLKKKNSLSLSHAVFCVPKVAKKRSRGGESSEESSENQSQPRVWNFFFFNNPRKKKKNARVKNSSFWRPVIYQKASVKTFVKLAIDDCHTHTHTSSIHNARARKLSPSSERVFKYIYTTTNFFFLKSALSLFIFFPFC